MTVSHCFVDTNVLAYAAIEASEFHAQAVARLAELNSGSTQLWVSRQVLRELARVLLAQFPGADQTERLAVAETVRLVEESYSIAEEGAAVTARLLELVSEVGFPANLIHDANIVATMDIYGIGHILTNDRSDFQSFSTWATVMPLAD